MRPEAAAYFRDLWHHLRFSDRAAANDIVRELETHLEDRVQALRARGIDERAAVQVTLRNLGRPETLAHLMRVHAGARWTDTCVGATAPLIVAFLVGSGFWARPIAVVPLAMAIIAVTLWGLWQGRPPWFYPWAGVALTLPVIAGYLAFLVLRSNVQELPSNLSAGIMLGLTAPALFFAIGAIVMAGSIAVVVRRDWLDASVLLSPMPGVMTAIIAAHRGTLGSSPGESSSWSPLIALSYVFLALATIAVLRARTRGLKIAAIAFGVIASLSVISLLDGQDVQPLALLLRSAAVVAFLLSPALLPRQT
jgi:hypothetical protein